MLGALMLNKTISILLGGLKSINDNEEISLKPIETLNNIGWSILKFGGSFGCIFSYRYTCYVRCTNA